MGLTGSLFFYQCTLQPWKNQSNFSNEQKNRELGERGRIRKIAAEPTCKRGRGEISSRTRGRSSHALAHLRGSTSVWSSSPRCPPKPERFPAKISDSVPPFHNMGWLGLMLKQRPETEECQATNVCFPSVIFLHSWTGIFPAYSCIGLCHLHWELRREATAGCRTYMADERPKSANDFSSQRQPIWAQTKGI
jgi:hypothetical protein